jgi:hypothetical protein
MCIINQHTPCLVSLPCVIASCPCPPEPLPLPPPPLSPHTPRPHLLPGIAIGGDTFPGSTLSDHCIRYQNIPQIKMIVVLGELGGRDEYSLVEALKAGGWGEGVCVGVCRGGWRGGDRPWCWGQEL